MITEKQQALIDKVMDCFDFRKVVSYMKRKKWGWVDTDGRRYIPEEAELRAKARKLMRTAIEKRRSTGTGGFIVFVGEGYLNLLFCIEEYLAENEDSEIRYGLADRKEDEK